MHRVPALPAEPQFAGAEGKARTAEKIKKRNDAYWSSPKGREQRRAEIKAAHKRVLGR